MRSSTLTDGSICLLVEVPPCLIFAIKTGRVFQAEHLEPKWLELKCELRREGLKLYNIEKVRYMALNLQCEEKVFSISTHRPLLKRSNCFFILDECAERVYSVHQHTFRSLFKRPHCVSHLANRCASHRLGSRNPRSSRSDVSVANLVFCQQPVAL